MRKVRAVESRYEAIVKMGLDKKIKRPKLPDEILYAVSEIRSK